MATEKATLELVKKVLGSILVESIVNSIMKELKERLDADSADESVLEIREIADLRAPQSYIDKGTAGPVYRPVDREDTDEQARAEAKGIDPLDRDQLRMVLDQGGYIRVEIAARRYTLYENESSPVCLISEDTWNDLIIEGEIICDAGERKPGTTIWIGA